MRRFALAFAALLAAVPAAAQQPPAASPADEVGRPLIRNYSPKEYGASDQNWSIVQDERGVLYVGNNTGVLEYDGTTWRRIVLPNKAVVRSLAIGPDKRIHVGGVGEFGYLESDEAGASRYASLLQHVPAAERQFSDVWRTFATESGVYYQTNERLFRWAGGTMRTWSPPGERFGRGSMVDGRLYLPLIGKGLLQFAGDELTPHPGTEQLATVIAPVILRYDDRRVLVVTRQDGCFLYDGTSLRPFTTELDAFFRAGEVYRGERLPDGSFALATVFGGLGIIDAGGRRLHVIDKAAGLRGEQVYYVTAGRSGALWLGLASGLARVEIPSPVSIFGESEQITDGVNGLQRHLGDMYVATTTGVFRLVPRPAGAAASNASAGAARFERIPGINTQSWWFVSVTDLPGPPMLLLAASDGLYEVKRSSATPIHSYERTQRGPAVMHRSRKDPSRIWVGYFDGFGSVRWSNGTWIDEGRVEGIPDEVRSVVEDEQGRVWLGTGATGALRLTYEGGAPAPGVQPKIERFGSANGLPEGGIAVVLIGNTPYSYAYSGMYRLDESTRTFTRDEPFPGVPADPEFGGYGVLEASGGRVYVNYGKATALATRKADGSYDIDTHRFSRFADFSVGTIYAEKDVVWFGGGEGIVRYDARLAGTSRYDFGALVRRVSVGGHRALAIAGAPRLSAGDNALRFEFAAPSFENESANEFQSLLEGLETEWSDWTRQPTRDYTNLGVGDYRLRVRARNVHGVVSREAEYRFTVLPPWYRTWWAYLLYVVLAGALIVTGNRVQRRRLVGKERERARLREAQLRAESAEALAKSESERKQNIELLSEIGKELTSSLDFDTIFFRLYEHVNKLADADVFGVGLYDAERNQIDYRLAVEQGKRYTPYSRDASDKNQFPVWCIEHRAPVFINDVDTEYSRYIETYKERRQALEDGSYSKAPQSLIYLPLLKQDVVLGIITIQSFRKQAYTDYHLRLLQSLAAYTSIALDNASAYRQLNEQEHEIRRLFEEAQQARAAAEEADAAKSAFLSTVSHELRTPLTSVLGFAKIIKKRLEEKLFPLIQTDDRRTQQTMAQVQENLKVVVSEGERLTKLIDDVLDLAKIEAGKLEWHMEPITLPEVIDHATAATSSLFEAKGLALVKDVQLDLPVITADRDRIIQVVINLISNAVKFTDRGSVTCRAVREGGEIVVSVVDTGVGISPADQPKVFEKFKQVGDTLTDKPKGTGLGLPICREIVEHHGGRIWVHSEIGVGSTFSFALPIVPGAVASAPMQLEALVRQLRQQVVVSAPAGTDRQPSILVVDDEAHIRELLNQELTEAGYRVRMAANGRDAIAEVRRERPDLVVLDVMMPEMNGFDVAAVLKNDPQTLDIPIIVLSIVQDRERGFRLGVDRYLTKPIDTAVLFREVDTLLEQGTSHKRVLVVDEDQTTVKTLADVLKARGYSVSEANGAELVEKAVALQPDIIILNAVLSQKHEIVQSLRFEKGLENVVFVVYQ